MLAIPKAKCNTEHLDTSPIANCLINQHACKEELVKADLNVLEVARRDAIMIDDACEVGQQRLLNYCFLLKSFVARFKGLESQLQISTSWTDAFAFNLPPVVASNFYLDWACCVWNLAAFESLMGARVDRSSEEGIRAANKHFQQAAGYIEYIVVNIHSHLQLHGMPCLSADGLHMVKHLMLAQAQLCFYEKAVKDKKQGKMKSAIIAKLAKQTSVFYHTTSVSCKVGTLGTLLDSSWFSLTDFQSKCFQGAAEYWQAHASKESALEVGTGFGEEIARYTRAENFVNLALVAARQNNIAAALVQGTEGLKSAMLEHKAKAMKDLQQIYIEAIPQDSALSDVVPVTMVRPSAVSEPTEPITTLFKFVLPLEVRQSITTLAQELSSAYVATSTAAMGATNQGRTSLSAVGLPGSIEASKTTESPLPPSLWSKVQGVQEMGGPPRLQQKYNELKDAAMRTLVSMGNIDEALDREEKTDNEFVQRYPKYSATRSAVLNADVRANTKRMREAYQNAQRSDGAVAEDLRCEATTSALKYTVMSKDQLVALFTATSKSSVEEVKKEVNLLDFDEELDVSADEAAAAASAEANAAQQAAIVSQLEDKLHDLADLIECRDKQVDKLKGIAEADLTELSVNAFSAGQEVSETHLKMTAESTQLQEQINSTIAQQEVLMSEIFSLNTKFVQSRQNDPTAARHNEVIQMIEQAVAKFSLILSQITAGITFYSSLQSKLGTLLQTACDVAFTQQWQRQDYESACTGEMERAAQELRDRDMALRLANDTFKQPTNPPVKPPKPASIAATAAAAAAAVPTASTEGAAPSPLFNNASIPGHNPATVSTPVLATSVTPGGTNAVVYGTPVAGPPNSAVPIQQVQDRLQQLQVQNPSNTNITYAAPATSAATTATVPLTVASTSSAPPFVPTQPVVQSTSAQQQQQQQQQQQPQASTSSTHPPQLTPQELQQQLQQFQPLYGQAPPPPPAQAVPAVGTYQYNASNYSVAGTPMPQSQQALQPIYQQQQQGAPTGAAPASQTTQNEWFMQVNQLCEMGFPLDKVVNALNANNGDSEASLNSLLSGTIDVIPASTPAAGVATATTAGSGATQETTTTAAAPAEVPPPRQSSGLFNIWGKKN